MKEFIHFNYILISDQFNINFFEFCQNLEIKRASEFWLNMKEKLIYFF